MRMIECKLELLDNASTACLVLETNGHSFAEVERATRLFIIALQERIDNKEKCPFHPNYEQIRPTET